MSNPGGGGISAEQLKARYVGTGMSRQTFSNPVRASSLWPSLSLSICLSHFSLSPIVRFFQAMPTWVNSKFRCTSPYCTVFNVAFYFWRSNIIFLFLPLQRIFDQSTPRYIRQSCWTLRPAILLCGRYKWVCRTVAVRISRENGATLWPVSFIYVWFYSRMWCLYVFTLVVSRSGWFHCSSNCSGDTSIFTPHKFLFFCIGMTLDGTIF